MAIMPPDSESSEIGVYYDDADYAGVLRRLLVDAVDVCFALAISFSLTFLCLLLFDRYTRAFQVGLFVAWIGVWFVYFTVLKRSTLRTPGYCIGGVRIVNLKGERPGLGALSLRLLFALVGPFNFVVDLIWITNDDRRQALRDKFAGTYVIRRDAQPIGRGVICYNYYTLLGTNFIFADVGAETHA